ncbi:hypothetical protein HMI55_001093 [Coelomomyces lativittatus]|nr:hypothetical protein HMI55_001093 [Coelomomyces lativittatus]
MVSLLSFSWPVTSQGQAAGQKQPSGDEEKNPSNRFELIYTGQENLGNPASPHAKFEYSSSSLVAGTTFTCTSQGLDRNMQCTLNKSDADMALRTTALWSMLCVFAAGLVWMV